MQNKWQYPVFPGLERSVAALREFSRLKYETGARPEEIQKILDQLQEQADQALATLRGLPEDAKLEAQEPDQLEAIRLLRPRRERQLWPVFLEKVYTERLAGALLGRMAGCTLGAPVEFWPVEDMEDWAAWLGDPFPPVDYWSQSRHPNRIRYGVSPNHAYTKAGLDGVPVDDDVAYTLLGLLLAEEYGLDFTRKDVAAGWLKYLPMAYTAEAVTLENLKKGLGADQAGDVDNPFVQWIGADIRSDPWGYMAPGLPEKAATMAYHDASLSHRRNGVYGAMYFSAVIAAAFACDDAVTALKLGLNEIPQECLLAKDIRWALQVGLEIKDYKEAHAAVKDYFDDMSGVHTNINACLTIFGLMLGGNDFTRSIGETVAMGYDNDCTAATVGSIWGAVYGKSAIPAHWYEPFKNKIHSYLIGLPSFAIDDVLDRFTRLARQQFA